MVFAFDQWSHNQNSRQFILAREPDRTRQPQARKDLLYTAWAIDSGLCFGQDWTPKPPKMHGHHSSFSNIYAHFDIEKSAVRGAQFIESLPAFELNAACHHIPPDWFGPDDEIALENMLGLLHQRQSGFTASIHHHLAAASTLNTLAG
jgi:hypothetical protein